MAAKTIPSNVKRMIGHIPFSSVISEDKKKGTFIAHTNFNGTQLFGNGPTERQATLDLKQQIDSISRTSKVPTRG